jgi:hypothetical protein
MTLRRSSRLNKSAQGPTENEAISKDDFIDDDEEEKDSKPRIGKKRDSSMKIDSETKSLCKTVKNPRPLNGRKKEDNDDDEGEDERKEDVMMTEREGSKRKIRSNDEPRKFHPEEAKEEDNSHSPSIKRKKKDLKDTAIGDLKKTTSSQTREKIPKANKQEDYDEPEEAYLSSETNAGKPDGNGGLDNGATYIIEYSKTSRATCKRCDIRINKNELRVGHRPLFRGKPGYQVFKHLHCIVFSEEIACAEDVEGFESLTDEDYAALAKRVDESFKLVQKENEELEPDELVQKTFDGEMRDHPKGLAANLLPFQEEGLSWMYHQERNVEDVRGGILGESC